MYLIHFRKTEKIRKNKKKKSIFYGFGLGDDVFVFYLYFLFFFIFIYLGFLYETLDIISRHRSLVGRLPSRMTIQASPS